MFQDIETPRLVLDRARLQKNADSFLALARQHGVKLRPHLKTSKSVDVARIATGGEMSGVTVSTLKEVAYFAAAGFSDILYAVGITPNKFAYVQKIERETGKSVTVILDNLAVAESICAYAKQHDCSFRVLIEIDCGEHRGGIDVDAAELIEIARVLDQEPLIKFKGVMTHAGHSYTTDKISEIEQIAEDERLAVVTAAARLLNEGIKCEVVSVGSTPTFMHGKSFQGVSEVRCGVYLFFDLAQNSRQICILEEISISVLASVIGHNRKGGTITVDAGAFALSKDFSANTFNPKAGYGYVCDADTMERLDILKIDVVHQEHGAISVDDEKWYGALPIGSMVRIFPNHACPTASAYDSYLVIDGNKIETEWPRISGW